jgi:hypothetical protein
MDIPVNSTIVNIFSCTQDQPLFSKHDGRLIMHRTHIHSDICTVLEKLEFETKPPRLALDIF